MSTGISKIVAERNHRILMELVLNPGNDVCADCRARAPRWASYNLGIFICVNCASIHRKIGTHVTKIKSITLDEWSKEQVEVMKEKGNIKSNRLYNPDEVRNPPPTNMIDLERDSDLEKFIRSKYEFKRFMDRKSGSGSLHFMTGPRSRSTPLTDSAQIERKPSPGPPLPPKPPANLSSKLHSFATNPSYNVASTRSLSQHHPHLINYDKLTAAPSLRLHPSTQSSIEKPAGQVWEDLISLQEPAQSSFPLQYSPVSSFPSQAQDLIQQQPTALSTGPNPFLNLSPAPNATSLLVASPTSTSTPHTQFPFAPSPTLASPANHLGTTNPFNQLPLAASVNPAFPTGSNPFSAPALSLSMFTTPSAQPVIGVPTGGLPCTSSLLFVPPQPSTPAPPQSFPPKALGTVPTIAPGQNHFAPIGTPGQMPLREPSPFSAMQMGLAGFSGTPQTTFGTTAFLSQQQQLGPNEFGAWAGQSVQRTF